MSKKRSKKKDDLGDGQIDPELRKKLEQEAAAASYLGYALDEEEEEASDEETLDGEATEAEYRVALSEEHNTGSFVRKFLLAIIRAHEPDPTVEDSDAVRLGDAAKALFGSSRVAHSISRWRNEDHLALGYMARMYVEDRGGPGVSLGRDPLRWLDRDPPGARPQKLLAKLAKQAFPATSTEETLANKFSVKGRKRELCSQIVFGSDVPGTLHLQVLHEIKEILEPLGVKMRIGPD